MHLLYDIIVFLIVLFRSTQKPNGFALTYLVPSSENKTKEPEASKPKVWK